MERILTAHHPEAMAVETLLFNRNVTTAMQVSEARGVVVLTGARRKLPIIHCTPPQVKMAVTGYGRADKAQVKAMILRTFGLEKLPGHDDAIDAIAIALTGEQLLRTAQRLTV